MAITNALLTVDSFTWKPITHRKVGQVQACVVQKKGPSPVTGGACVLQIVYQKKWRVGQWTGEGDLCCDEEGVDAGRREGGEGRMRRRGEEEGRMGFGDEV